MESDALSYEILENNILLIQYIGRHDTDTFFDFVREAVSDPALTGKTAAIIDLRFANVDLTTDKVREQVLFWPTLLSKVIRIGVVTNSLLLFGKMRQAEGMASWLVDDRQDFSIFEDLGKAINWASSGFHSLPKIVDRRRRSETVWWITRNFPTSNGTETAGCIK